MQTPFGPALPRHAEAAVRAALEDTRVVLVNGARQSGKSTLVRLVAKGRDAEWRDLDTALTRNAALEDPDGFVDQPAPMVIDEVQRAPDLLLAIKARVDADPTPGRFLLTGSARVLGLRSLPDTLVGRMETIELWPFSQGEIDRTPEGFIDAVFTHGDVGAPPAYGVTASQLHGFTSGIRRTACPWGLSGGSRTNQRPPTTQLLQFLCRRPHRARCSAIIGDRTDNRDARACPDAGRSVGAAAIHRHIEQRTRTRRHDGKEVCRTARRGLSGQADTGVVSKYQ